MIESRISKNVSSSVTIISISLVIILIQIVDMTAGGRWTSTLEDRVSTEYTIIYFVVIIASLFIHLFLLINTAKIAFKTKKATSISARTISLIYITTEVFVIIFLGYLLGEQLITSQYNTVSSQVIAGLSLLTSSLIITSLSIICLKAYFSTRYKTTGLYGLALIAILVQLVCAFLYVEYLLDIAPQNNITPSGNPSASTYYTEIRGTLSFSYQISTVLSFIAIWVASVVLTKPHSQRIGKIKYWIMVIIPVFYFLFQYSDKVLNQFGVLNALLVEKESIFLPIYNFTLNTSNTISALLFGISFFIISRTLVYESLRYYLIMYGAGIMIIFSSNVTSFLVYFPAWSIVSISFILPASFLTLIGLDSATFYIAGDNAIRGYLNRFRSQFEFFKALGYTKVSDSVQHTVNNIRKNMEQSIEIDTLFKDRSDSEDVSKFVSEIITELKKSKTKSDKDKSDETSDNS